MERARTILHIDMDAFYASVEQRDDPSLRGRPLVVGGGSNRGVVAAASYEARQYGIHSAMPMREALRRCPQLLRLAPRMSHYRSVSEQVFAIFRDVTPLVEGLSLDEAFLDVTGSIAHLGSAERIARRIKQTVRDRTGLTASVGVAPNKLVAKIASDLDKPDGLVVVTADNLSAVLDPLPAEVIPGIGHRTLSQLHRRNIRTIAELRTAPDEDLEAVFGRLAPRTRERAAGVDHRPVVTERPAKSLSAEATFEEDLCEPADLHRELLRLAEKCAARLRKQGLCAGTVQLKIRRADFTTFTRQYSLPAPTDGTNALYACARSLLRSWQNEHPGAAVRLLGIGASDLGSAGQGDLFHAGGTEPGTAVDRAVDRIRERFGTPALGRARALGKDQFR